MKYICFQPGKFENMSENEGHATLDECFDYDDESRANGHFAAGEALQPPDTATTLYWKNGKVAVTDLPALGFSVTEHEATEYATHVVLTTR